MSHIIFKLRWGELGFFGSEAWGELGDLFVQIDWVFHVSLIGFFCLEFFDVIMVVLPPNWGLLLIKKIGVSKKKKLYNI